MKKMLWMTPAGTDRYITANFWNYRETLIW